MTKRLPTFLGLGAPKSATTWLHRCLSEHPQVFVPAAKELNFFAFLDPIDHRLDEYSAHFENAAPHHLAIGEISTNYLAFVDAPGRVGRHLPECRFIVSLRNPREQVISHYWHLRKQQFHGRLGEGLLGKRPPSLAEALVKYRDALVEPALYSTQLQRWFSHFERDRFHIILYDDIRRDPAAVLRNLYAFLGIDAAFAAPGLNDRGSDVRAGVSPRSPQLDLAYRIAYRGLNRFVYHPLKQRLGWARADALKRSLRVRELLEATFFRRGYPEPTRHEAELIDATFSSEIDRLETLLGRDLAMWRRG